MSIFRIILVDDALQCFVRAIGLYLSSRRENHLLANTRAYAELASTLGDM